MNQVKDLWLSDETMRVNMGPQHPSTHGVLRLQVTLSGETVLKLDPVIGYLHTGIEKNAEGLNWIQAVTAVTRADYLSPFHNETAFCLAVEKLAGVAAPERAQWLRILMCELNRISSHLLWLATTGLELGGISIATYGFRERETILDFFQAVTGLRMNHNYVRPGGVSMDLPEGATEMLENLLETLPRAFDEYEELITGNPIWVQRNRGVGVMSADTALKYGVTGPSLRASGVAVDLRKSTQYLPYDKFDFDICTAEAGDCFARYRVRMDEMRESLKIIRQVVDGLPAGEVRAKGKMSPPSRDRINVSMEALIHHFKLYTDGPHVPEGECYVAVESPRGELGMYIASTGGGRPLRVRIRPPSFVNLQCVPEISEGALLADLVAILASIDPVMGDVDR